jgi:hypothetical protein
MKLTLVVTARLVGPIIPPRAATGALVRVLARPDTPGDDEGRRRYVKIIAGLVALETKASTGVTVLNRMPPTGCPKSVRCQCVIA